MKRRVAPILTFTVALVLVSAIAYAAKKKDQAKSAERTPDPAHEEEALQAELLEATGEHAAKVTTVRGPGAERVIAVAAREKGKDRVRSERDGK